MNVPELIQSVNARIPGSVTPETRIEIHPSEWLALVDAARTPNQTPVRPELCHGKAHTPVAVCAVCGCFVGSVDDLPKPTLQKVGEQPPGDCNKRGLSGDPCDRNCNWPECGCVPDGKGGMRAATASLLGDRAVFKLTLERHMHAVVGELDWLIGLHDRWGDSMQKHSLHKARSVLKGGIDWFAWERRRNRG